MHNLILTLFSIALMGMAVLSTMEYLNPQQLLNQRVSESVIEGFESLEKSFFSYADENQVIGWVCDQYTTESGTYEDCTKEVQDPGYLVAGNWETRLFPDHGYKPVALNGVTWSYNYNDTGYYFCLGGDFSAAQVGGIKRTDIQLPEDKLNIAGACGQDVDDLSVFDTPASMKVTYWVKHK